MSENQNYQEFDSNLTPQEEAASEELSEADLEGIAGGAQQETFIHSDGSRVSIGADGSRNISRADGTTITRGADGSRDIRYANGSVVIRGQ